MRRPESRGDRLDVNRKNSGRLFAQRIYSRFKRNYSRLTRFMTDKARRDYIANRDPFVDFDLDLDEGVG